MTNIVETPSSVLLEELDWKDWGSDLNISAKLSVKAENQLLTGSFHDILKTMNEFSRNDIPRHLKVLVSAPCDCPYSFCLVERF